MEQAVLRGAPAGVVLRYGGLYGPGTWYSSDGDVTTRMRKQAFPIIGRGDGITSFVHVDDAASAAVAALTARASAVYNVVDDEPARAADWIPEYAAAVGGPRPFHLPTLVARVALGRAMTEWMTTMRGASNARIKAALGWRPKYPSWRDGFRHLA
jgi:nucleoside-diphosphate-sugar epimerase